MPKPPASFADHGWRAIAMCGTRWMVAARYEDAVIVEDGIVTETWDAETHAKLFAAAPEFLEMLGEALDLVPRISESDPMAGALAEWCKKAHALIRAKATGAAA